MATFSVPSSPARQVINIDTFEGVDFTNSPANIEDTKSPNAVNMIRDVPGKVRKRMGYYLVKEYEEYIDEEETEPNRVNGYHFRNKDDIPIYHIGNKLYKDDIMIYEGIANNISHAWAFNDNLYIIDGKRMLKYDGETCAPVDENGYIPLLTIAKDPSGGGTQYEDFNLVSDGFKEGFAGKANVTAYQLTFGDLNSKTVKVEILNNQGVWVEKTEGRDFTVDRTNGIVNFTTAPGVSPLTGEDNVMITAFRTVEGYADRINHCTFGTRFGVNGAFDRLFLSGNSDYPNADWYSQQWDCTYFPDTGYSLLGSSQSAIVGYSIISNYLAAHKDELEKDLSIIIREGDLVDNNPSFRIINTLQGAGAISSNSFAYLRTEPLFLTRNGLFAVTAQDITGEKYAQSRSFFLNGKLMEEDYEDLRSSRAIIFNDMYLLAVKNNLYILDGLQPIRTDRSEPYATRQYAGFYCDNLPIHYMWEWENVLYFGTENGKIFAFYKDKESTDSYNDNGNPIHATWETADLEGKFFYKNKSFRYLAVKLGAAVATSIRISGMRKGVWSLLKEDNTKGRYFSYMHLIYSKFSYSTDTTERIVASKTSIKKVDKTRFKFENENLNEPFSLFSFAIEYTQNNNVKG